MVAQRWCFSNRQLQSMWGCTNKIFSENLLSGRILSPCIWGTKQADEQREDTTGIGTNETPWNCRHARFNYSSCSKRERKRERKNEKERKLHVHSLHLFHSMFTHSHSFMFSLDSSTPHSPPPTLHWAHFPILFFTGAVHHSIPFFSPSLSPFLTLFNQSSASRFVLFSLDGLKTNGNKYGETKRSKTGKNNKKILFAYLLPILMLLIIAAYGERGKGAGLHSIGTRPV